MNGFVLAPLKRGAENGFSVVGEFCRRGGGSCRLARRPEHKDGLTQTESNHTDPVWTIAGKQMCSPLFLLFIRRCLLPVHSRRR